MELFGYGVINIIIAVTVGFLIWRHQGKGAQIDGVQTGASGKQQKCRSAETDS